jgi:hypothetical protein
MRIPLQTVVAMLAWLGYNLGSLSPIQAKNLRDLRGPPYAEALGGMDLMS